MNARRVNSAAEVILAALTQNRTAAGIALALESAGFLVTPELEELRARVSELETERKQWRSTAHRLAGDAGLIPRESSEDVTPQVTKLRALLAGQRLAVAAYGQLCDDPHGLHHDYRLGRDLPTAGA